MSEKKHIFERVTEQVIAAMERDQIAPWHRPWTCQGLEHRNAVSKKPYRGINVLILSMAAQSCGYTSPRWMTFAQAKALGGSVRKGEKGTRIVFWSVTKKRDKKSGEEKKSVVAREYVVFNEAQCDGLELPALSSTEPTAVDERSDLAEKIINHPPCPIAYGGDLACYYPGSDQIRLPVRASFVSHAAFYSTAFHEIGHSTGAKHRLDRELSTDYRSHEYSKEELVAEFCACMLTAYCGVERTVLQNSVSYLKIWARKLRDDPKLIASAAQAAQKAADYTLQHVFGSTVEDAEAA